MRTIRWLVIVLACAATPAFSFQHFYGYLHSHTGYSDGEPGSVPFDAYVYAWNFGLDFLAVTDHNYMLTIAEYREGLRQAADSSVQGEFAAIYGMEWGRIANGGHLVLLDVPALLGWDPYEYEIHTPLDQYLNLYLTLAEISEPGQALALMAHPQIGDYEDYAYRAIDGDDVVQLLSVVNGPASLNATDMSGEGAVYQARYFDTLAQGWHLAPTADQDNHEPNWGASSQGRTVILAEELTPRSILEALSLRRCYATMDHNLKLEFSINDWWTYGERVFQSGDLRIYALVEDGDGEPVRDLEIYTGRSGSGNPPQVCLSASGTGIIDATFSPPPGENYYFVKVTQEDGHKAWSAPVWVINNQSCPNL
ncbi:CehA/McbA family metallohydrolase, partial [Acidobacteriota bacterium]